MAATARRYETRALLRAHLSAASEYRHLTRHCPICHRLQRLAMERCTETDGDAEGYEGYEGYEAPGANSGSL
ncbi:DUF6274 family protein [Streptomyces turgidiscabies]|uniref:Uncharacterized protein n=1 Tax=Streptomyces turgidiscabies TaxID=85558 RepID=A0ABU0RPA7_9ACTN|nr:DUF6274 family protein [Streptomyces turgidiscabies]MDQ0933833.1 hypothetical protein [Streptomyces turgidiscabies]